MTETVPTGFTLPSDEEIHAILDKRAAMEDYPLTPEDVRDYVELLTSLVKETIETLAGMNDRTPMTIVKALNTAMMSQRWLERKAPYTDS